MGKAITSYGVALLVKTYVVATSDATRNEDKVYYELDTTSSVYKVAGDNTAVGSLYELCASSATGAIEAFVQLACLTDVPDIGGEASRIETTTLCDKQKTYIQGIIDAGESLDFSANYVYNTFKGIKSYVEGKLLPVKVVFGGLSGADGTFSFNGYISARVGSFGVDEVVPMTISVAISSEITFA